jgi:TolB protein
VAQSGIIDITNRVAGPGLDKPIPVSLSGFSGEVASVIQFDLYVQGFKFVGPEEAQFLISGSNSGNVQGRVADRITKTTLLTRSYSGASLRRQAHAFTDDVVAAITHGKGIALTRIACKVEKGKNSEIFVADFDGHGGTSVTSADNDLAKSPAWVPGEPVLYYTLYKNRHAWIYRHNIATGVRRPVATYGGSNLMPAPSPDGSKVAMILSKSGKVDLYLADADGTHLKQLTDSKEEESSPCWSPDGRWICFATKIGAARVLAKIPADGGTVQRIRVAGVANPSEPDWSPDGKWIAFTAQMGDFELCVVPAEGGSATVLVSGEDPSWSPNSRTLVFNRRNGSRDTLSLLDVPTKQVKDVPRISGSNNSQPAWAR